MNKKEDKKKIDIEAKLFIALLRLKEEKNKKYSTGECEKNIVYLFDNYDEFKAYFELNGFTNISEDLLEICRMKTTKKGTIVALKGLCDYTIKKHKLIYSHTIESSSDEGQLYIEEFKESEFSSYDFMSLFCAFNAFQKNYSFNRDNLINFIKLCKESNKFTKLLNGIRLKSNGIFSYSEELDEAIAKLKWGKILYTISPEQDASIFIFENIPMSELIKKRISYFDEMVYFLSKYTDYESEIMRNAHQKQYNQEAIEIDNAVNTLDNILSKILRREK